MGRYAGRFVVDTHVHAQRAIIKFAERGIKTPTIGGMYSDVGSSTWVDNTGRLFYDMERYGIDVCIIQSGGLGRGMDVDMDMKIAEKYPGKFAVLCYPTTLHNKAILGKAKWSVEGAAAEMEKRLKTGKYAGIGQGLPLSEGTEFRVFTRGEQRKRTEFLSDREKLERGRVFYDLAAKYKVAAAWTAADLKLLEQLVSEYPDVPTVMQLVGYSMAASREVMWELCQIASSNKNLYLEMGGAPAELYEIPLSDPNVGPTQIVFGTDWGSSHHIYSQPGRAIRGGNFTSQGTWIHKWGPPRYQPDYWGWALHQIDKLRDVLTQDELNLILGGNAARIFKLDVPYTRLFPEGRVDLWGTEWEKYSPYIPRDQVKEKFEG